VLATPSVALKFLFFNKNGGKMTLNLKGVMDTMSAAFTALEDQVKTINLLDFSETLDFIPETIKNLRGLLDNLGDGIQALSGRCEHLEAANLKGITTIANAGNKLKNIPSAIVGGTVLAMMGCVGLSYMARPKQTATKVEKVNPNPWSAFMGKLIAGSVALSGIAILGVSAYRVHNISQTCLKFAS
jgi:hypothetical protein